MLVFPPTATPHVSAVSHKRLCALIESIFKKNTQTLQLNTVRNMKIHTHWYKYIAYSPWLEAQKSKNQATMTISTHSELFINMRQWCSASETLWSRMEDRTASRNQGVRADVKIVDACKQEGGEKKKKSWSFKLWDPFISSLFWYWYIVNSAGGSYETHLQAAVCTLCNRLFQRTAVISQKLDLSPTRSVTLLLKKKKKCQPGSWQQLKCAHFKGAASSECIKASLAGILATEALTTTLPPPPPREKSVAGSGPCNYRPLCCVLIDASWWSSSVIEE